MMKASATVEDEKTYIVHGTFCLPGWVAVQADSEADALKKAGDGDYVDPEYDTGCRDFQPDHAAETVEA